MLDPELHHLRASGAREWAEFPAEPDAPALELNFSSEENAQEQSLWLRQQDVKRSWRVELNGEELGRLFNDENDMVILFPIPPGTLVDGQNQLQIAQDVGRRADADDIRVGEIVLDPRTPDAVLRESTITIDVVDADSQKSLPARITIINQDGALQMTGAESNEQLAVRPGTIYTATGQASVKLPTGTYTVYAGRGFEYSLDETEVTVAPGESAQRKLTIRREVSTEGYIACDPHVHSRTHSGHGDATVQEQMITLAAEGVELPIATDHNVHIDHDTFAREARVRSYFTPVIGNEVTTKVGHFNVFPVEAGARIPNFRLNDWEAIFDEIYRTPGVKAVILNHGRDLHAGTRPLGPKLHNAVVGENLEEWPPGMNAMEVINSSATQSDPMQLFHDWMALLNRGRTITPVGSSDSHDVARHFVGQARTYIRCDDRDPAKVDVEAAVANFIQGRVLVSYGLMAEMQVAGKYGSGELARVFGDEVKVEVRVLGPHWVQASRVRLYANGQLIREEEILPEDAEGLPAGVQWTGQWSLPLPEHDVHLVAIATGPGIEGLYWRANKPYQPTSPQWEPQMIGCSGAVWLDVDQNGRRTAARDYAERLYAAADGSPDQLIEQLAGYDAAVAAQAAHLYQSSGQSWLSDEADAALQEGQPQTQAGIRQYLDAWRACQMAQ